MSEERNRLRGPLDPLEVPRFAGPSTFARLPTLDELGRADVAVVGVPFDSGVTFRPGARFGPRPPNTNAYPYVEPREEAPPLPGAERAFPESPSELGASRRRNVARENWPLRH